MYNQQERSCSVVFAAGFVDDLGFTGFHISLFFSCAGGGVSFSIGAGVSSNVAGYSSGMFGCSSNVTCFLALIIFSAAALACAGVTSSTCRAKMSSAVSSSSFSCGSSGVSIFSSSSDS
jgi:hypothetical protein